MNDFCICCGSMLNENGAMVCINCIERVGLII